MKDGYWNQQRQYQPPLSSTPHGGPPKRHRSDFEGTQYVMPLGDMHSYLSRDEDRGIPHSVKDTRTIGSVYDRYLQSVRSGDPIVLCFVNFENPACAATALSALQGYRMDEEESDSKILRLQFSESQVQDQDNVEEEGDQ
ncbi:unnamed protein product [Arabidopsis arenosa]|uniref:RRM domain-containing protein n=1 Tax=Arabidopsis arenosa TaxID=38785 RepID=A0A8S1ZEI2_ARAAE|nr:unnamed protein product [Arabidopsis arenosa]